MLENLSTERFDVLVCMCVCEVYICTGGLAYAAVSGRQRLISECFPHSVLYLID